MKKADDIGLALENIQFVSIDQYIDDVLSAFNIPRSTITRLLSSAKERSFADPVYVYRRAAIVYETGTPDIDKFAEYEKNLHQKHRLLLVIGERSIICKDTVSDEIVEFSPSEVRNYLDFFTPLIYGDRDEKDLKVTTDFTEL